MSKYKDLPSGEPEYTILPGGPRPHKADIPLSLNMGPFIIQCILGSNRVYKLLINASWAGVLTVWVMI